MARPENQFYAVLQGNQLIAFRSFGEDGRVLGGEYDGAYLDTGAAFVRT